MTPSRNRAQAILAVLCMTLALPLFAKSLSAVSAVNADNPTNYTRNPPGQLTFAVSSAVSYAYDYDSAQRRTRLTDGRANMSLQYSWSAGGRLNRLSGTGIPAVDSRYDAAGSLILIRDNFLSYVTPHDFGFVQPNGRPGQWRVSRDIDEANFDTMPNPGVTVTVTLKPLQISARIYT